MKRLDSLLEEFDPNSDAMAGLDRSTATYGQLQEQLARTGEQLGSQATQNDLTVAIVIPNGPLMASAFVCFAPWCTVAPLNPAYTEAEFEFYFEDLRPDVLVVPVDYESPVVDVAKRKKCTIWRIESTTTAGLFELDVPKAKSRARGLDAIALVLHTSGTTSRPKMVPLSQRNLLASAANIMRTLNLSPADTCLNVMPLFHIHGLMAPVLATLCSGGTVWCSPGFDALRFFKWLAQVAPSWYSAVPTMHQAIATRAERNLEVIEQAKLRFIRSSSAALPVPTLVRLEQLFETRVVEAYAMTEAAHQMCSNPMPPAPRKPGFVGPAAGPEVRISATERLEILGVGEEGEIVIRGENVTSGYLHNPEANERDFTAGWFRTGDLGFLDADGYLKVTGRLKEIINRGGEKIAPLEVDEVLVDHPAVAQACTFAIPHPTLSEDVGAVVVLEDDMRVETVALRHYVRQRLSAFKVPRTILIRDEIPKGATGKVQRIGMATTLGLTNESA